jgi:hypothetical protein
VSFEATKTTWSDKEGPKYVTCPSTKEFNCRPPNVIDVTEVATFKDNCQADNTNVVTTDPKQVDLTETDKCGGGQATVTYSAKDICGNKNEENCVTTYQVKKDDTPPVITFCPDKKEFKCSGDFNTAEVKATDDCNKVTYEVEVDGEDVEGTIVAVTCNEEKKVTVMPKDECNNPGDVCEVTVKAITPDPVCKTPISGVSATCNIDPTKIVDDSCGPGKVTPQPGSGTCVNPPTTIYFDYERTSEGSEKCRGKITCPVPVSIKCQEDTAFGKTYNAAAFAYGNRQLGLDSSWGWGSYYASLPPDGEIGIEYKMYAGDSGGNADPKVEQAPDEKYVGSVYVKPVAGTVTAKVCSSAATITDFHLEISQPSPEYVGGYHVGGGLYCRPLRPPGHFAVQPSTSDFDCVVGEPCCVAVHWEVNYETACTGDNCQLVNWPIPAPVV